MDSRYKDRRSVYLGQMPAAPPVYRPSLLSLVFAVLFWVAIVGAWWVLW